MFAHRVGCRILVSGLVDFDGRVNRADKPEGGGEADRAGDEEDAEARERHVPEVQEVGDGEVRLQFREVQDRVPAKKDTKKEQHKRRFNF